MPNLEGRCEKPPKFKRIGRTIAGHSRGKTLEIPVLIPDSRELGRESGLLRTAPPPSILLSIRY
jgi:hypothetical protein